ncbi:pickpocket protein 28 isoform X1 [Anastrepha ludens]|uniref:pickpocket protein 28 isoform X1 n=1 Tax=Anastrepha ludens TaxID=28586 RepID=UPI0023B06505|nr:pickpocket protein 28 isoform X1 [Anastrepha ludens]
MEVNNRGSLSDLPPVDINTLSPSKKADSLSTISGLSEVPSDIIIKSRIKYGTRWSACKGLIMEYSKNTTIHGIRYLVELHRPFYEKLYWFIVLVISVYFAISLIWATYLKWQDTPVILGFDETLVPVHKIPFPTITICPEIKMERNVFDFPNTSSRILEEIQKYGKFENLENLSETELEHFMSTLHICESDVVRRFAQFLPKDIRPNIAQTLVDISISKNETGPFCKWNGRFYFCDKIFNFVPTDEGICYQFNGLQAKDIYRDVGFINYYDEEVVDFNNFFESLPRFNNLSGNWSLEEGYVDQGYNSYPQRTAFSSARNGFFAFLQGFEHNFEYACRSFKQGYKVFLTSPESVPVTTGNYILVPHGDEVMVSVLPHYVISTDNLHDFSPEKRQCYFNDERYLRYFRFYSQSNCQVECLTNYTINKCGCAKFWMPKPHDVPVCSVEDISCYDTAQSELRILIQNQTIQATMDPSMKIICDCMPACTSLDYNVEISSARYDLAKTIQAFREVYEHTDFLGSRLSVYFKEHQFTAIKRTVLFSVATLIANWGGILGLFMGISSLSLIELVYFFSVRLFDNLRKRRQTKKRLMKLEAGHES